MLKWFKKGKALVHDQSGSSLIEIVISMALLLIVVASVGSGIKFAVGANARSRALMQEQQAVANAVERLMATGITVKEEGGEITYVFPDGMDDVSVDIKDDIKDENDLDDLLYLNVTVTANVPGDDAFSIDTTVHATVQADTVSDEGGGDAP